MMINGYVYLKKGVAKHDFLLSANIIVDELMTHLIQAVEVFREQQAADITEEVRG